MRMLYRYRILKQLRIPDSLFTMKPNQSNSLEMKSAFVVLQLQAVSRHLKGSQLDCNLSINDLHFALIILK